MKKKSYYTKLAMKTATYRFRVRDIELIRLGAERLGISQSQFVRESVRRGAAIAFADSDTRTFVRAK